jgi:uncharacterized membrane protein YczE
LRNKLIKLVLGNTLAAFSISCVVQAGFGCFSTTAANAALASWFGISIGVAGMIIELIMLTIATWKGEGLGWTSIINATYGSLMIDVFLRILPKSPFMVTGLILLPIAWAMMGSVGLGENGSNTLMNAILKNTNLNITVVRGVQEFILLLIGFLGARDMVTIFTIILVFGLGPLLEFVYKIVGFEPTAIKHKYLIKLGGKQ